MSDRVVRCVKHVRRLTSWWPRARHLQDDIREALFLARPGRRHPSQVAAFAYTVCTASQLDNSARLGEKARTCPSPEPAILLDAGGRGRLHEIPGAPLTGQRLCQRSERRPGSCAVGVRVRCTGARRRRAGISWDARHERETTSPAAEGSETSDTAVRSLHTAG